MGIAMLAMSASAFAAAPEVVIDTKMGKYRLQPQQNGQFFLEEGGYQPSESEDYIGILHDIILTHVKPASIQIRTTLGPALAFRDDKLYPLDKLSVDLSWEPIQVEVNGAHATIHMWSEKTQDYPFGTVDPRGFPVSASQLRDQFKEIDEDQTLDDTTRRDMRSQIHHCLSGLVWTCGANHSRYQLRFVGDDGKHYQLTFIPGSC